MLILLPPSEGKRDPHTRRPLDLAGLSFPELTRTRQQVLDALVEMCRRDPEGAVSVLGLTPGQADWVRRNAVLPSAPAAPAASVYSGVLYEALDLATLSTAAKRRAASRLVVASPLFGLLRPKDRIPAYKLGGGCALPGVGPLGPAWRDSLGAALSGCLERGLVIDLRSGTYASYGRPPASERRFVTVRVLQEVDGVRGVVSHFNKATKGRLVRSLLEDATVPGSVSRLTELLGGLGWRVERADAPRPTIDVIVTDVSGSPPRRA